MNHGGNDPFGGGGWPGGGNQSPPSQGWPPAGPPQAPPGPGWGAGPASGPPSYPPPPGGPWQAGQPGQWNTPPQMNAPQPAPPNNNKPWIIGGAIAGVLVLLVVIVVVVSNFTGDDEKPNRSTATGTSSARESEPSTSSGSTSTTSTAAAAPGADGTVEKSDLEGLLLSADEIGETLQASGMTAGAVETSLSTDAVTPPECASPWAPAAESTFSGSGYTDVVVQTVQATDHHVVQALILFPDQAAAQAAFQKQLSDWKGCHYKTINATYDGLGTDTVKTAVTGEDKEEQLILMSIFTDISGNSDAISCDRASALRANVIVDVRGCSRDDATAGYTLARDIGEKITGER